MELLNELPQGWKWVKLGDVCSFEGGSQPEKSFFKYQPLPDYIRLVQIQDFRLSHVSVYIPKKYAKRTFNEDDVMIGRYGPPVFQILRGLSGAYNVALMKAVPKNDLSKDYLFYLLQESSIQDAVIGVSQRSAGQSGVDKRFLEELPVPIAPLPEQQRLAKLLSEKLAIIEQAKQKITAQLQAAQDLTAAYLREVFESEEAKGWEWIKFEEIADFKNGINFNASQKGSGLLTIDVFNMYSNSIYIENNEEFYRISGKINEEYLLNDNDILFVRSSVKKEGVGWTTLFKTHSENVTFCGFIIRARMKIECYQEFIVFYFRSQLARQEIIGKAGSSTITNISQENLKSCLIPLPPVDKQQEIAIYLTEKFKTVEQLKATLQSQLESINQLPAALLKQAFSGQL